MHTIKCLINPKDKKYSDIYNLIHCKNHAYSLSNRAKIEINLLLKLNNSTFLQKSFHSLITNFSTPLILEGSQEQQFELQHPSTLIL